MRTRFALDRLFIAVSACFLGLLTMTGIAAAVLFPMVKGMGVTSAEYADYSGEHWRLVAGGPANALFVVATYAGLAAGMLGAAMIVSVTWGRSGRMAWARRLGWAGCVALWLGYCGVLAPLMQRHFGEYRSAARQGDGSAAAVYAEKFRSLHPWATRVMGAEAILLVLSIGLAVLDAPACRASCDSARDQRDDVEGARCQ